MSTLRIKYGPSPSAEHELSTSFTDTARDDNVPNSAVLSVIGAIAQTRVLSLAPLAYDRDGREAAEGRKLAASEDDLKGWPWSVSVATKPPHVTRRLAP